MNLVGINNAWLSPSGKWVIDHELFDSNSAWHNDLGDCILLDRWKDNDKGIELEDKLDVFDLIQGRWDNEKNESIEVGDEVLILEPTLKNPNINKFHLDSSTEVLERLGWIRLHGFGGMDGKFLLLKGKTTKKQKDAIIDWQLANGKSWNKSVEII